MMTFFDDSCSDSSTFILATKMSLLMLLFIYINESAVIIYL